MTKISNQYSLTNILTADLANSRLGINNVSPAYSLDLTGTARISGVTTFSSNVGVGVVPQTWYSTVSAIQFSSGGALWGIGFSNNIFSANEYLDAAATSKYIGADAASRYQQNAGNHVWSTAGSGTAGSNISFTERMRITSAGNVGIGTSSPGYSLHVNGTAYAVGHIGGYVTASSGYVNETQTITTNGTSYYLRKYTGNANGSSTTIFNITGLNTANGTFADIYAVAQKDATGSAINTNLEVQINGQYMYGIQANGTAANTRICAFKVCRMDSSWVIIGTVRT